MSNTENVKFIKEIKRKHGTGSMKVLENKKGETIAYQYDYPFARDIKAKLRGGDITFISEKLSLDRSYVSNVLLGKRYNEGVLDFALLLIEKNKELKEMKL